MQSCVVSINQKRQVREAGKFTHLPKCSPSTLLVRYIQCCTAELGTEPPEPAVLAFTHIPDSVPNPQSAHQALVTLRTTELALVGRWLESRRVANMLYRESGRLWDGEGAPNGEALGTWGLSGVDGNGRPERLPFALFSEERGVRILIFSQFSRSLSLSSYLDEQFQNHLFPG